VPDIGVMAVDDDLAAAREIQVPDPFERLACAQGERSFSARFAGRRDVCRGGQEEGGGSVPRVEPVPAEVRLPAPAREAVLSFAPRWQA